MMSNVIAFEFPPINELLRWKDVWAAGSLNKVGLIAVASALIGIQSLGNMNTSRNGTRKKNMVTPK